MIAKFVLKVNPLSCKNGNFAQRKQNHAGSADLPPKCKNPPVSRLFQPELPMLYPAARMDKTEIVRERQRNQDEKPPAPGKGRRQ